MLISTMFSALFICVQFSDINCDSITLQVKSKSPEKGSEEKIELQLLSSRLSKQEKEPFTATEEDSQLSRRDSPEKSTEPSTSADKEHQRSDRSPLIEPLSRAEARSRSVEDLPKKPKTFKFRDSKSSDV